MPVTRHPPHSSRRAARPHRAPASGLTCRPPKGPAVRGRAWVTGVTRPCVRSLVCAATFPLARSLPSTSSAGSSGQPVCAGFLGTLKRSDSLHPCITGVPRGCPVRTWHFCARPDAGPPGVRSQCFHACQRSPTPPGPSTPRQSGIHDVAIRVFGARRHPGLARLRGSILCLHLPLATLRAYRYR
jgi:hypothetical protein